MGRFICPTIAFVSEPQFRFEPLRRVKLAEALICHGGGGRTRTRGESRLRLSFHRYPVAFEQCGVALRGRRGDVKKKRVEGRWLRRLPLGNGSSVPVFLQGKLTDVEPVQALACRRFAAAASARALRRYGGWGESRGRPGMQAVTRTTWASHELVSRVLPPQIGTIPERYDSRDARPDSV